MCRLSSTRAVLLAGLILAGSAGGADKAAVKAKWHTPYDLYLTPEEAYSMKTRVPDQVLFIDVRARGEVQFAGFTDLADANLPIFLFDPDEWREKKGGVYGRYRKYRNPDFVQAVENLLTTRGMDHETPIILMCTSGGRSPISAADLHAAGFSKGYTQYQGFEGVKAKQGRNKGQRVVNGWKNAGLPWSYNLATSKMYFNFAPKAE